MRSIKLPLIVVTASLSFVLAAAAGASARPVSPKSAGPHGPCRVLIEVPRGPVSYGDPLLDLRAPELPGAGSRGEQADQHL